MINSQFLCIHDDIDNLIESALDSKLLSISSIKSQRLDKKEQEVKIVEEQPAELAPILSTKEPENSLIYDDDFEDIEYVEASHLDPEIVRIEEENGVEEENVVQREEKEVDLEDIFQVQDV
nr:hypothetical protein [Tanacetum cinerariifolium]